ncbi:uncharacterized protein LOC118883769 [Balaenoptera musculus]|uniref:Uncharacterized protein LOC118883769 n=1 Tax=Balaenoptera musculus TaxID=9771 RepID=A0A8B8VPI6_BALMU|nr:uncharacterized protein LOC118883769 [Balaenoptera musculus]
MQLRKDGCLEGLTQLQAHLAGFTVPMWPPLALACAEGRRTRLGVALLDVGRAVGLREYTHPRLDLTQLPGAPPVHPVALVRQKLQPRHAARPLPPFPLSGELQFPAVRMPHFRPPGSYGFRSAASHFRCRRTTVLPGFPAAPLSALPVRGEVGLRPFGMTVPRLLGLETRWAWNPYVVSPPGLSWGRFPRPSGPTRPASPWSPPARAFSRTQGPGPPTAPATRRPCRASASPSPSAAEPRSDSAQPVRLCFSLTPGVFLEVRGSRGVFGCRSRGGGEVTLEADWGDAVTSHGALTAGRGEERIPRTLQKELSWLTS